MLMLCLKAALGELQLPGNPFVFQLVDTSSGTIVVLAILILRDAIQVRLGTDQFHFQFLADFLQILYLALILGQFLLQLQPFRCLRLQSLGGNMCGRSFLGQIYR